MADEPKQNADGESSDMLVLPIDAAVIRWRVLRTECALLAIGLAVVGCAWFVYTYYGEAAPEMPFWKLAVASGVVVAIGMAVVFAVSKLYWRRTVVGIAADFLAGPPLDPRQALLSTPRGHMTGLPYAEIGIVVLTVKRGVIVSALVHQGKGGLPLVGVAIPDHVRDIHLALLAVDERAGDRVRWMVPGWLRGRQITREEAVRLIKATAEAARGSGGAERAE